MDRLVIQGQEPLNGTITASGNKNAALKLLPACLLTEEPVILHNVPDIADVRITIQILEYLGATAEPIGDGSWRIHAKEISNTTIDQKLGSKIRASIVYAGPMLGRAGRLELPPPGGDIIGRRRVDTHILALKALGAKFEMGERFIFSAPDGLKGADILLDEASVTATENAIMAAVLARGTTILRNAATEPHVQDMCNFLNTLGGQIEGIGSNVLIITGVDRLHGGEFSIGADFIEVGSFIGAAAITGGRVRIRNASPEHLAMVALVYNKLGVHWEVEGQDVIVPEYQPLKVIPDLGGAIPEVKAQPWPAFPSDLMSIALVIATQAEGTVLFHEWMYDSRFFWIDKLVYLGARTVLCDPHRCLIQGPTRLRGDKSRITSPDIRAGMALVLAALCAEGTTIIHNVGQIDRGYQDVDGKLRSLGAKIIREKDE
ncbi:MAG: UDP-N-acetylglucosamine 1-carboxyvinyltransferase [Anaerolineae bacterium]|nr:UDP-N-acetylglucosamine 1-carboxyvinyltransferase [Anaerolineae bacterium]